MGTSGARGRSVVPLIGLPLVAMLVSGCTGMKPYEPRDYREDGMEKGLISGADGAFVIFRRAGTPASDSEED